MKFKKKPVIIEAVQFLPEKGQWPLGVFTTCGCDPFRRNVAPHVHTAHGVSNNDRGQRVDVVSGDWIVPESKAPGCFYPIKDDVFRATYEAVADGSAEDIISRAEVVLARYDRLLKPVPCFLCNELCDPVAGNPGKWPVHLGNGRDAHTECVNRRIRETERAPSPPTGQKRYMVMRNAGQAVFVKEYDFFVEQGGLREAWGRSWVEVSATSIEDARLIGERILPRIRRLD